MFGDIVPTVSRGDELARKRTVRDEKMQRVLTRPQEQSALRDAEREATEARRLAADTGRGI
jgi:hypothetical protein